MGHVSCVYVGVQACVQRCGVTCEMVPCANFSITFLLGNRLSFFYELLMTKSDWLEVFFFFSDVDQLEVLEWYISTNYLYM